MKLTWAQKKDIIEWDIVNWSKALNYCDQFINDLNGKKVLVIGDKNGGLSLYFALRNATVYATDLNGVSINAKELHTSYNVLNRVIYGCADFLHLEYPSNEFDIVAFKSVLGALRTKENQITAIAESHRVLKSEGLLVFSENLDASWLHQILRKKFVKWAKYWRYLNVNEVEELFGSFPERHFAQFGFFGTLGRSELQRTLLGLLDTVTNPVISKKYLYILAGVLKKVIIKSV